MDFLKRYKELPIASTVLVAANVIIFLLCAITGDLIYNIGGLTIYGVLERGEYRRLIWSMFLHADLNHLFNNMLTLFFLGSLLEKEIGPAALSVIYFISGIGGNITSLLVKVLRGSMSMSVGASGAVFGMDGLLFALVLMYPSRLSPKRVGLMIVLSLYNGFMSSNIDNAAHVGGLLVGFVAGLVLCLIKKNHKMNF